jgi:hypothetical protein
MSFVCIICHTAYTPLNKTTTKYSEIIKYIKYVGLEVLTAVTVKSALLGCNAM